MRSLPPAALILALAPALALTLMLSGCGSRAELKPRVGQQLPVAPVGRDTQPTARDLLAPSQQARPNRSVELRERSEERTDDPFDLPPKE